MRERIDANPMRAFDADDEGTRAVMAEAPRMIDRLADEDAAHFAEVRGHLDRAGVEYELDGTLVRGLDYYTRTVFEFESDKLGAQAALGGGGRYDGLVAELGGPEAPACGWAAGIERILLAIPEAEGGAAADIFVVAADGQRERALAIAVELRRAGLAADLDLAERSIKGQMKQANRVGAAKAVILGEDGDTQLRDMETGEQRPVDPARVVEEIG